MTQSDRHEFFVRMCALHGQSNVAKRIGRNSSTISQILSGTYGKGKASPDKIYELVEGAFGTSSVVCPELGEIPLAVCIEERDKPFAATSSQRVRLYRACRTCPNKGGTK